MNGAKGTKSIKAFGDYSLASWKNRVNRRASHTTNEVEMNEISEATCKEEIMFVDETDAISVFTHLFEAAQHF
jgi:hypothetical protein